MKLSQRGAEFIQKWEDCKLSSYMDSGRVWTIGWGHTGPDVKMGTNWTQAQADAMFLVDIVPAEQAVNTGKKVALTQDQFDALVSFAYNVGTQAFLDSTLLKLLNESNYAGAADQFLLWNHVNGNIIDGLTKRRFAESTLFRSAPLNPATEAPVQSLAQFLRGLWLRWFGK